MTAPIRETCRPISPPAMCELRDQTVYVADVTVEDSGWARLTEWNGDVALLPPHQCGKVRLVTTEYNESQRRRRVADEAHRREALESAGISPAVEQ